MSDSELDLSVLDNTTIRIAGAMTESIVDGPGIRYVIFTQGCPFHCKGCHNPQAQTLSGGMDVKLRVLYDEFEDNPFIQTGPLTILAKFLKKKGYSVWSYSGYTYDKLVNDPIRRRLLEQLDVVVDGPFVMAKKSIDLDFRGSSNQRIINVQESLKQNKVVLMEGFN